MRLRVLPPTIPCSGAAKLAREIGARRLRLVRTRFRPRRTDVIVNWGNTSAPFSPDEVGLFINEPQAVESAVNKVIAYRIMAAGDVPCVPFTCNEEVAGEWLRDGDCVVARTLTRASSGRGIIIVNPGDPLPASPLYTKYVKKRDEYRVHVAHSGVFDIQQKRRRRNYENRDNQIRNHHNGWVYCREGIDSTPQCVLDAALKTYEAFDLDFCAVDIGYNAHYERASVYEVNTAPGLEGQTLLSYSEMVLNLVRTRSNRHE